MEDAVNPQGPGHELASFIAHLHIPTVFILNLSYKE